MLNESFVELKTYLLGWGQRKQIPIEKRIITVRSEVDIQNEFSTDYPHIDIISF